jgi:hypothetical protein
MFAVVQIDWSARWKVVLWSSWLRWRSRVDLEEKCRLGPVREWLQVSGCSLGLGMGGGQSLCVWLVAVVVLCEEGLAEEGLASRHHWETVMMRDGMRVSGRCHQGSR